MSSQGAVIQQDFRTFDFFKKLGHLGAEIIRFLGAEIGPREKFADSGNASFDATEAEKGFAANDESAIRSFLARLGGHREFLLANAGRPAQVFSRHVFFNGFIEKNTLICAGQRPHAVIMGQRKVPLASFGRKRASDGLIVVERSSRHTHLFKRANDEIVSFPMFGVAFQPYKKVGQREAAAVPNAGRDRDLANLTACEVARKLQMSIDGMRHLVRQIGKFQVEWAENLRSILKREFLSHFSPYPV